MTMADRPGVVSASTVSSPTSPTVSTQFCRPSTRNRRTLRASTTKCRFVRAPAADVSAAAAAALVCGAAAAAMLSPPQTTTPGPRTNRRKVSAAGGRRRCTPKSVKRGRVGADPTSNAAPVAYLALRSASIPCAAPTMLSGPSYRQLPR